MIWRAACVLYTWWLSALAINPCRHIVRLPVKSNEKLRATSPYNNEQLQPVTVWIFRQHRLIWGVNMLKRENFLTPPLSSAAGWKNSSRLCSLMETFIEAYNKGERRKKPNQADTEANGKTSQDLLYRGSCAHHKTQPSRTQAHAAPVEVQPQNTHFIRPPPPPPPPFPPSIHLFMSLMFDSDSVHYLPSPPHPLALLISSPCSAWGARTTWRAESSCDVEWGG